MASTCIVGCKHVVCLFAKCTLYFGFSLMYASILIQHSDHHCDSSWTYISPATTVRTIYNRYMGHCLQVT